MPIFASYFCTELAINCALNAFGSRDIIQSYVCRWAAPEEQLGKVRQHVLAAKPPRHRQGQTLAADLVDDRQDAELSKVMRTALDEIVGPHMAQL